MTASGAETNELQSRALEAFQRLYGTGAACVSFAPGRVEVLGNHTDYNGGYVLSVALDLGVAIAAARRPGPPGFEIWSETLGERVSFPLSGVVRESGSWANYPKGVIVELERARVPLAGARLAIASDLPIGAGVSSSAALELATAEALYDLFGGRPAKPMDEALLCQRAEKSFVGVPCGLLDQFSSLFGKKDHALFLDCATLRYSQLPLGRDDIRIVLADSGEKHALIDGKYAALRQSCERARDRLAELLREDVQHLRDVSVSQLERHAADLDPEDRPRAEHVIRENDRVIRGLAAIRSRFYPELSRLMLASHASSRDVLGNSTPALDDLVVAASDLPGFLGGKLTGGGFGGSTVNLVEAHHVESFASELAARFERKHGRRPRLITARIGGGARVQRL